MGHCEYGIVMAMKYRQQLYNACVSMVLYEKKFVTEKFFVETTEPVENYWLEVKSCIFVDKSTFQSFHYFCNGRTGVGWTSLVSGW